MRYLPLTPGDRKDMLAVIGADSIDDLFQDIDPSVRLEGLVDLPTAKGELEVERALKSLASRNVAAGDVPFFVGGGAYRHHIPATVDHLIQRSEFLTAYTPYQPEISQGTLQSLFEFQSQVAMLTGMEVANASMYDGSTACGEAVLMAHRLTRRKKAVLCGNLHPQYQDVVKTISQFNDTQVEVGPISVGAESTILDKVDDQTSCVVIQNPDFFGRAQDLSKIADAVHDKGALLIVVVTEIVSLGLMKSPGSMGADIVVGEGQSLGVGLNFGGPYLGLFATRQKFVRQMPGRVCGETIDSTGKRGFVLTLSTREQHIRREKATSNICTNSGLCCLAFTIHMTLLGETGLKRLAKLNHQKAGRLADALAELDGVDLLTPVFFNEFTLRLPKPAATIVDQLAGENILGGLPASRLFGANPQTDNLLIVTATETNTDQDIANFARAMKETLS